jgi:hypothetical protein
VSLAFSCLHKKKKKTRAHKKKIVGYRKSNENKRTIGARDAVTRRRPTATSKTRRERSAAVATCNSTLWSIERPSLHNAGRGTLATPQRASCIERHPRTLRPASG